MIQSAIDESLGRLKENGLKHTKKRVELITLLAQENRYWTAKDVHQALETDNPSLSFDTVYRNLYSFIDIGILEMTELNNEKMFRMTCLNDEHHHHHFICEKCNRTIQLEMCPMDFFEQQLKGCQLTSHRFEIFGICSECVG